MLLRVDHYGSGEDINLRLYDSETDETILELKGQEVIDLINDGELDPNDWTESMILYAENEGLIEEEFPDDSVPLDFGDSNSDEELDDETDSD